MARKRCPNGTRRIGNKCVKKSRDDLEFEAYERWENRKEAKKEKEMLDWDYTHGSRATMPNYRYRKSRR
jgi:hypothetical protein